MHPQPWFSSFFNVYFEKLWHLLSLDIHWRKWLIGKITQVSLYHWQTVNRNVTTLKFTWCHLHIFFCLHANCTSPIMHLICLPPPPSPPQIGVSIVCNFSWDGNTQEKWKTKVMQNFGGQIRCIMGDVQVAYLYTNSNRFKQFSRMALILDQWSESEDAEDKVESHCLDVRRPIPKRFFFISLKFENPWLFCHLRPKEDKSTSY